MLETNKKRLIYSQYDLGKKYKVYIKSDEFSWRYYGSFDTLKQASDYYEKIESR